MKRDIVQVVNPRRHGETCLNRAKANEYCAAGQAHWLRDGRLKFRESDRRASDVCVEKRGTIWWNGARSYHLGGQDRAMFLPGSNVLYPKAGAMRAAKRLKGAA